MPSLLRRLPPRGTGTLRDRYAAREGGRLGLASHGALGTRGQRRERTRGSSGFPPLPVATRRAFLKGSLQAVGIAAALPLVSCAEEAAAPAADSGDLRVLRAGEYLVLAAAADALVPRGGAFAAGARDVDVARRIDTALTGESEAVVRGLRAALLLLEYGGGVLARRIGRFSCLDEDARSEVLESLRTSGFGLARGVYLGLKRLCVFFFYAQPQAWEGIGYDGPWVGRAGSSG